MNLLTVFLQAQGGGDFSFLIMMLVIFAIMYFFMIRPQNKKQKEIANFRKNLEVGQSVITAGGIYGKIKELEALCEASVVENQIFYAESEMQRISDFFIFYPGLFRLLGLADLG